MRIKTLQIAWHNRDEGKNEPVMSLDVHPKAQFLATAGADHEVKLWALRESSPGQWSAAFVVALTQHTATVNAVRFSPDGRFLATAGDDASVIIWKPSKELCEATASAAGGTVEAEDWRAWGAIRVEGDLQRRLLPGHRKDVYDLTWSPDSSRLASASVDNSSMVWAVDSSGATFGPPRELTRLTSHAHFVQGVAWDPADRFLATASGDRTVHVHSVPPKTLGAGKGRFTHRPADVAEAVFALTGHRLPSEEKEEEEANIVSGGGVLSGGGAQKTKDGGVLSGGGAQKTRGQGISSGEAPQKPSDISSGEAPQKPSDQGISSGEAPQKPSDISSGKSPQKPSDQGISSGKSPQNGVPPNTSSSSSAAEIGRLASAAATDAAGVSGPQGGTWGDAEMEGRRSAHAAKTNGFYLRSEIKLLPGPLGAAKDDSGRMRRRAPAFLDETLGSFFRRPAWTPDGSLLVCPAGAPVEPEGHPTTLVFLRGRYLAPAVAWPTGGQPSVAVRCCPILFESQPQKHDLSDTSSSSPPQKHDLSGTSSSSPPQKHDLSGASSSSPPQKHDLSGASSSSSSSDKSFTFPYRMIVAVATLDEVLLYATDRERPIAKIAGAHYERLTDMAWLPDARTLVLGSFDGYCSFVHFEPNELGIPIDVSQLPAPIHMLAAAERDQDRLRNTTKPRKPKQSTTTKPPQTTSPPPSSSSSAAAAAPIPQEPSSSAPKPSPSSAAAAADEDDTHRETTEHESKVVEEKKEDEEEDEEEDLEDEDEEEEDDEEEDDDEDEEEEEEDLEGQHHKDEHLEGQHHKDEHFEGQHHKDDDDEEKETEKHPQTTSSKPSPKKARRVALQSVESLPQAGSKRRDANKTLAQLNAAASDDLNTTEEQKTAEPSSKSTKRRRIMPTLVTEK